MIQFFLYIFFRQSRCCLRILGAEDPQPEGIAHYKSGAETHSCRREHGIQFPFQERIEHPSCQRDTAGIIEKCPEQIFFDIADGGVAQFDSCHRVHQVAFH